MRKSTAYKFLVVGAVLVFAGTALTFVPTLASYVDAHAQAKKMEGLWVAAQVGEEHDKLSNR